MESDPHFLQVAAVCLDRALRSRLPPQAYADFKNLLIHWKHGFFHTATAFAMLDFLIADDPLLQAMRIAYTDVVNFAVSQQALFQLAFELEELNIYLEVHAPAASLGPSFGLPPRLDVSLV